MVGGFAHGRRQCDARRREKRRETGAGTTLSEGRVARPRAVNRGCLADRPHGPITACRRSWPSLARPSNMAAAHLGYAVQTEIGPGDNFDSLTSHVLPALIRRFHEAKEEKLGEVVVWVWQAGCASSCMLMISLGPSCSASTSTTSMSTSIAEPG